MSCEYKLISGITWCIIFNTLHCLINIIRYITNITIHIWMSLEAIKAHNLLQIPADGFSVLVLTWLGLLTVLSNNQLSTQLFTFHLYLLSTHLQWIFTLDLHVVVHKRHLKTNKKIIPKSTYGYFIFLNLFAFLFNFFFFSSPSHFSSSTILNLMSSTDRNCFQITRFKID